MSDIPPVDTLLGSLAIDEVFIDYDGPKLFTCINEYESSYLAVFADEEDASEIYLYAEISPTQLDALRTGQVTFREAFEKPSDGNIWVVRRSLHTTEGTAERVSPEAIPEDWLPSVGARLVVEAPSIPAAQGERNDTLAGLLETFGKPDSLQIQLSTVRQEQTSENVHVSIRNAGTNVAFNSTGDDIHEGPVEPSQILHDLARAWPFIEWEESNPWGETTRSLAELSTLVQNDEEAASSDLRRERGERNREFVQRHNLARIFWAEPAHSLLAFRKGMYFDLLSPHGSWTVSAPELLNVLQNLGDALANRLKSSGSAESEAAVDAWRKKRSLRPLRIAEIATGIGSAELRLVEQALGDNSVWISPDDPASNEIYAAARMSAGLSSDEIAKIVGVVSSTQKFMTSELDALSHKAARAVDNAIPEFETGYYLAEWYRKHLGLTSTEAIDPEQRLRSLGVKVRTSTLSSVVDAVAVWGPRHGPCVIVNSTGRNSRSSGGRRITLAHELAHMLLDRNGFLPLAEVLGGRAEESVEVRARAFAAELLLPREVARNVYVASPDSPEEVVDSLVADYGVSREVAAWQIRNSGVRLTARGRSALRSYVRNPWSF